MPAEWANYMLGQLAELPPPGDVLPPVPELGVEAGGGFVGDVWAHATAAPPPRRPAATTPPASTCLSRRFMPFLSARVARL